MMYVKFLMCLGLGLVGLCIVLTALIDSLFSDWDVVSDVRTIFRQPSLFARELRRQTFEDDDSSAPLLVTRLQMHERRNDRSTARTQEPAAMV